MHLPTHPKYISSSPCITVQVWPIEWHGRASGWCVWHCRCRGKCPSLYAASHYLCTINVVAGSEYTYTYNTLEAY